MKTPSTRSRPASRCSSLIHLAWLTAGAVIASLSAGCQHEVDRTARPDPVGEYALISVNGNNLPCTVDHEGHSVVVKSGSFRISADGACQSTVVFSVSSHPDATRVVDAHYTQSGSTLTMRWHHAGTTTGTISTNSFTMNNEGMIFAYRK